MKWKIGVVLAIFIALVSISAVNAETLKFTTETGNSLVAVAPPGLPGLTIDQQQATDTGATYMGTCYGHPWQSFVPSKSILSAGAIHIAFDNPTNTENLTMHIRASPNGTDLTKVTVPESSIVIGEWLSFDLPDIAVIPGNTYYIVMDNEGAVSYYGWSVQRYYDSYPAGTSCTGGVEDWTFATYTPAVPSISVSTDNSSYVPGDTLQLTLGVTNPTANTYSSNLLVDIRWPTGNGTNYLAKPFTMSPGFAVSKNISIPIPDSIFVADGNYEFVATLTYDGSFVKARAPFTIKRGCEKCVSILEVMPGESQSAIQD